MNDDVIYSVLPVTSFCKHTFKAYFEIGTTILYFF